MKRLFWVWFFVLLAPEAVLANEGFWDHFSYYYGTWTFQGIMIRIFLHMISAVIGAGIGYMTSDAFAKYRQIASKIWTGIFLVLLGYFVLSNPFLTDLVIIIFLAVHVNRKYRQKIELDLHNVPKKQHVFGASEWATASYLRENGALEKEGFLLGKHDEAFSMERLRYTGDRHLFTIAPTRSGKFVSAVGPNLQTYEGSCVCIDPKGECATITAARRGNGHPEYNIPGMGQEVHIIDPWGIVDQKYSLKEPSCFNPMDWLNPDDEDISENAFMLADAIIMNSTPDPFWDEESKSLLCGIMLYVATDEREKDNRNLKRVREIICMSEKARSQVFAHMSESDNVIVRSTAARTISKEDRLRSNVLAALQAHTHFLDSPRIQKSMSRSDFRFEDLKTKPMTIYIVLPADRLSTFGRWIRLLIQQAITVNARNIDVKPKKPVLVMCDELCSIGKLQSIATAFTLMAGFGVVIWAIIQDLSSLEETYGKGWETFISNSGMIQYFGSRDRKTAEYFSSLCGVKTEKKFSLARTISSAFRATNPYYAFAENKIRALGKGSVQGQTYSETTTEDIVQRKLMFPDELMTFRDGEQLVFIENLFPIKGRKITWYDDDDLKKLGINLLLKPKEESEVERLRREVEELKSKQKDEIVELKEVVNSEEVVTHKEPEEDLKKLTANLPTEPVVEEPKVKEHVKEQELQSSITKKVQERKEFDRLQNFLEARGMKVNRNFDGGVTVTFGKQEHRFASVQEFIKAAPEITGKK